MLNLIKKLIFDDRVLNEMEIQSTSIDTRGFQNLIEVVCSVYWNLDLAGPSFSSFGEGNAGPETSPCHFLLLSLVALWGGDSGEGKDCRRRRSHIPIPYYYLNTSLFNIHYIIELQKESSANDSFDLFRGLFLHNKFAIQEVRNCCFYE